MSNYQYITSKDNEKIKQIKNLEDKKYRYQNRLFVIEGIKPVLEVISSSFKIESLIFSKELLVRVNNGKQMLEKLEQIEDIEIIETTEKVLGYVSNTVTSQGILAVVKMKDSSILDNINDINSKIIILDKIQDSGNLGTIIRSADAFNVRKILCVKGTVDPYSPKVIRSTMGSILRVDIDYISDEEIEIQQSINKLKSLGYTIAVTSLQEATPLTNMKLTNNIVFVIGNEANGVSDILRKLADVKIKIPMETTAESLNVGIATGILLYNQYISSN